MAWRVAKSLLKLRDQVNAAAPNRSRASDGTIGDPNHQSHTSDHNPWVIDGGIGVVTGLDLTTDPAHGCDIPRIINAIVASRDPRIKYIIHNRKILSSTTAPWTWRNYTGPSPHEHHGHFSVKSDKAHYDNEAPWQIGGQTPPPPPPPPPATHKRLILAVLSAHDATTWLYRNIASALFSIDHFNADKDEVGEFLGVEMTGTQVQPIRDLLASVNAEFMVVAQHLADTNDPRVYVFVNRVEHV